MKGYMYILECGNGMYYTGSTKYLEKRLEQHQTGEGANFTKKHQPVKLVYFEEFNRIDTAFYREKQVQGWSRKKKEALINNMPDALHKLAECKNDSHFRNVPFGSAQGTDVSFDFAQGTDASFDFAQGTDASFDFAQGTDASFGFAQGTDASFGFAQGTDASFGFAQGTSVTNTTNVTDVERSRNDSGNKTKPNQ